MPPLIRGATTRACHGGGSTPTAPFAARNRTYKLQTENASVRVCLCVCVWQGKTTKLHTSILIYGQAKKFRTTTLTGHNRTQKTGSLTATRTGSQQHEVHLGILYPGYDKVQ